MKIRETVLLTHTSSNERAIACKTQRRIITYSLNLVIDLIQRKGKETGRERDRGQKKMSNYIIWQDNVQF